MKSNKSKKSTKLKLNLKPIPEQITVKTAILVSPLNQKLFLLSVGLFLISLSLLGLLGFDLGQKQSRLEQASIATFNDQNQALKPRILDAVGLAQNSLSNRTEAISASQNPKPELIDLPNLNAEVAPKESEPKTQIQPSVQTTDPTQTLENKPPAVPQKSASDVKNQVNQINQNDKPNQEPSPKPAPEPVAPKSATNFKTLTPNDFHQILLSHNFENTKSGGALLSATGLAAADDRINQIAQGRGFQRWPEAIEDQLVELKPNIKLLPKARQGFLQMTEAAKKDKVIITLNSGYRSQADQNSIFEPRYQALEFAELGGNYTPEELARGEGDELLNRIMTVTAPPGYSRHHTGYTVDLVDLSIDNTSQTFKNSKAAKWLSQNNFANARRFGFIPSYPEGLDGVGPQPEAWEYVWVGDVAR